MPNRILSSWRQRYKNEVWRKKFIAEFFRLQELYEFRFHLHGGGQQHRQFHQQAFHGGAAYGDEAALIAVERAADDA